MPQDATPLLESGEPLVVREGHTMQSRKTARDMVLHNEANPSNIQSLSATLLQYTSPVYSLLLATHDET